MKKETQTMALIGTILALALAIVGSVAMDMKTAEEPSALKEAKIDINAMRSGGEMNGITYSPCESIRKESICKIYKEKVEIRTLAPNKVESLALNQNGNTIEVKLKDPSTGLCKRRLTIPLNNQKEVKEIVIQVWLTTVGKFEIDGNVCRSIEKI